MIRTSQETAICSLAGMFRVMPGSKLCSAIAVQCAVLCRTGCNECECKSHSICQDVLSCNCCVSYGWAFIGYALCGAGGTHVFGWKLIRKHHSAIQFKDYSIKSFK